MTNDQMVTLKLSRNDVGQIIDGLGVRRDSWRETQKCLEGRCTETDHTIEECSDAEEASGLADCYDRIISVIQSHLDV